MELKEAFDESSKSPSEVKLEIEIDIVENEIGISIRQDLSTDKLTSSISNEGIETTPEEVDNCNIMKLEGQEDSTTASSCPPDTDGPLEDDMKSRSEMSSKLIKSISYEEESDLTFEARQCQEHSDGLFVDERVQEDTSCTRQRTNLMMEKDEERNVNPEDFPPVALNKGSERLISKVYVCFLCDLEFMNKADLLSHMNVHKEEKEEYCLSISSENKTYHCPLCNQSFSRRSELTLHKKSHTELLFQCSICSMVLSQKSTLNKHMLIHIGDKTHVCPVRSKSFFRKQDMKKHTMTHERKKINLPRDDSGSQNECLPHSNETSSTCSIEGHLDTSSINDLNHHMVGDKLEIQNECLPHSNETSSTSCVEKHKDTSSTTDVVIDVGGKLFSCPYCDKTYDALTELTLHKKKHTELPFQCNLCNKVLSQKGHLKRHLLIHKGEKTHVCPICGKRFLRKEDMKTHIMSHERKKNTYSCPYCDQSFSSLKKLSIHQRTHTGIFLYHCSTCKKAYKKKGPYKKHLLIHKQEQINGCSTNSQEFLGKEDMKTHMMSHERKKKMPNRVASDNSEIQNESLLGSNETSSTCSVEKHPGTFSMNDVNNHLAMDNSEIQNETSLTGSVEKHPGTFSMNDVNNHLAMDNSEIQNETSLTGSVEKHFDTYSTTDVISNHVASDNSELQNECLSHINEASSTSSVQKHLDTSSKTEGGKSFSCPHCDKTYDALTKLTLHKKKHTELPFQCTLCGKMLSQKGHLKRHMLIHNGERSHVCPICGRGFLRKEDMKKHVMSHERRKLIYPPYNKAKDNAEIPLEYSSYNYESNSTFAFNLGEHSESSSKTDVTIDKDRKYFLCPYCDESYDTLGDLALHERTHTEFPFQCNLCNQVLSQKGHLKRHMLIHKGEKRHLCPVCSKGFLRKEDMKKHLCSHGRIKKIDLSPRDSSEINNEYSQLSIETISNGKLDKHSETSLKTDSVESISNGKLEEHSETSLTTDSVESISNGKLEEHSETSLKTDSVKSISSGKIDEHSETSSKTDIIEDCEIGKHLEISFMTDGNSEKGEKSFSCSFCDKSYNVLDELIEHRRTHKIKSSLQCSICDRAFSQRGHLKRHMLIHTGEKTHVCSVCNKAFLRKDDMKMHMRIHVIVTELNSDEQENSTQLSSTAHVTNVSIHEIGKTHFCPICNKLCSTPSELKVHQRIHTGEKPYKCLFCEASFRQKNHLSRHLLTHSGEKPNVCSTCNKAFRRMDELKNHEMVHLRETGDICSVCDKFIGVDNMEKHLEIHKDEEFQQCLVCGMTFKTKRGLKFHKKIHSRLKKTHVCPTCGKTFPASNRLKDHAKIHTGEKPFSCSVCKKAFNSKYYLKLHTRIHTGEKPHLCNFCGKSFTWSKDLRIHTRNHLGIKPHKCQLCARSFSQLYKLQSHMKTHTGEKPHKCSFCDKMYSERRTLKKHLLCHTEEQGATNSLK